MARSPLHDEPDRAAGADIARALRGAGPDGLETKTVRAVARAAIFGDAVEGTRVDRYFVIKLLGSGGMGSVYAAYDPKLERKVALKVLWPDAEPDGNVITEGETAQERLVYEARALAKVRHSNVVHVYDAGTFGEHVYLTMELVEGHDLRHWLTSNDGRPWEQTLELFVQAGRGLAAAHAAGLVHRDFKPDNVLVGDDGIARVVDFGVARTDHTVAPDAPAATAPNGGPRTRDAGTPAYLAPERLDGRRADARSDLFSFCVALFEGLVGARPFLPHDHDNELSRRPPWPATVPGWLAGAVDAGLETDPEARPRSMNELLATLSNGLQVELARRRRRGWTRRIGIGAAIIGIAVAGITGARELDRRQRVESCEAAGAEIGTAWPGRADAVAAGIRGSKLSYAETTVENLGPWLSRWTTEWQAARVESCLDETLPVQLRTRADGCLEVRRAELEGLLDLLAAGDPSAIERAVDSAGRLAAPAACADRARLRRGSWPPDQQWHAVLVQQKRLAVASSFKWSGKYDAALAEARAVLAQAEALGWSPLIAAARIEGGLLHAEMGAYDAAQQALRAAYFDASREGEDELAASAALALVGVVGGQLSDHEAGLLWAEHTSVLLDRLGETEGQRRAHLLHRIGRIRGHAGKHREAQALYERAQTMLEGAIGADHPQVASILNNLANIHQRMAELPEARALHLRVLAIRERAQGRDHPDVSASLNNLAINYMTEGRYPEAGAPLMRAITLMESAVGPNHPRVANYLNNLGMVRERAGQHAEAKALYQRALAISERALGPEHPRLILSLSNLGFHHRSQQEPARAQALFERGLAILQRSYGPEHPEVAVTMANLGLVHLDMGEYETAVDLFERALPITEQAVGPDHPTVAAGLCNLAAAHLLLDRKRQALASFERCVDIFDGHPGVQDGEASARFFLAKVLVATGGDRRRALAEATRARDIVREGGDGGSDEDLAEVEAWIESHQLGR